MLVLVTGATGYVGGRLVPRLLERGHSVRVLVRAKQRIAGKAWYGNVEIVEADLLKPDNLAEALADVDVAYYLVHSMSGGRQFSLHDRTAATNFSHAAKHVRHVIYLGGLIDESSYTRSQHLRSRVETGKILHQHLPVTELRAGPIIGAGSASFEMVRYLTERLPVMIAPRWIHNRVRPIAIRDVLAYLLAALDHEPVGVLNIGAEAITFKQMMLLYAQVRGLRRWIIPVPVLAPGLAARWVGLVTPITNRLAVPLVRGLVQSLDPPCDRARAIFTDIEPIGYEQAVLYALQRAENNAVETRWSDSLGPHQWFELADWEGLIREVQQLDTAASTEALFAVLSSLGGDRGWLVWERAWRLRGTIDKLLGGPGLRRGRRHATQLAVGDSVDWWRVEAVQHQRLLRLRAEMKVPGRAWLQWEIQPVDDQYARLTQTALFEPHGLSGFLYWWVLYPLHRMIFASLVRAIVREAEQVPSDPKTPER